MKQPTSHPALRRAAGWAVPLLLGLALCGNAAAQTMEERLRSELRTTTQQLQRLQSEQAQAGAARQAAEQARDAALADLRQARADLEKARKRADTLGQAHEDLRVQAGSQIQSAHAQLAQSRQAYEQLNVQSGRLESQRQALDEQLKARSRELQVCSLKNEQLYQAGKEILGAYESFSTGDLLALRQPFSASTRVAFDMKAQDFGDALYEQRFDPAAVDAQAPTP